MPGKIRLLLAARALALCLGLLGACAVQQTEPPTTATETDATDGTSGTGASEPTGSTGSAECEGQDGCYDCKPTTPIQVLNACTDATCEPFANTKARLPLLKEDGTLPPLP